MWTPCYSVKQISFSVSLVLRLYKIHLIMWTVAYLSHKIVQYHWLIHQLDIIIALVRMVLDSGYLSRQLWIVLL